MNQDILAQARRFYHHVYNGGKLTPEDVSYMVSALEEAYEDHALFEKLKKRGKLHMMTKIEIDACMGLDEKGNITLGVYIGEGACEPVLEESKTLQFLIEDLLQAYTIPGEEKIAPCHLEEREQLVEALKAATKYAKKRIKELS
jgi:hypothetical protein